MNPDFDAMEDEVLAWMEMGQARWPIELLRIRDDFIARRAYQAGGPFLSACQRFVCDPESGIGVAASRKLREQLAGGELEKGV